MCWLCWVFRALKQNKSILKPQMKKNLPCVFRIKKSNNKRAEQKNNENMFTTTVLYEPFAKTSRYVI